MPETTVSTKPVALVTGGARGIGLGISLRLAEAGFDLAVCGRRAANDVADPVARMQATGASVLYCRADVADAGDRQAMLDAVRKRYGRLNVLVNNAGVAPAERADITEASEASFERVMKINLQGPYFLTQAAARWMIAQRQADEAFRGCVLFVSSVSATLASVNRGEYCLSKAGLAMAVQLWAVRLAPLDIPVYEIRPGVIATDMTAGVKDRYDALIGDGLTLQGRWGRPDDVGRAAAMLARGDLAYSTGQVILVDGGMTVGRL